MSKTLSPTVRVCFENVTATQIDDAVAFRTRADAVLDGLPLTWGGYIMLEHGETLRNSMEPLWQYVGTAPGTVSDVVSRLMNNPIPGYVAHVFAERDGAMKRVAQITDLR